MQVKDRKMHASQENLNASEGSKSACMLESGRLRMLQLICSDESLRSSLGFELANQKKYTATALRWKRGDK